MKSYHLLYENRIYEHLSVLTRDGACAQLFPPAFSPVDMAALEGYLAAAEAAVTGGFQGNVDAIAEMRAIKQAFDPGWTLARGVFFDP